MSSMQIVQASFIKLHWPASWICGNIMQTYPATQLQSLQVYKMYNFKVWAEAVPAVYAVMLTRDDGESLKVKNTVAPSSFISTKAMIKPSNEHL